MPYKIPACLKRSVNDYMKTCFPNEGCGLIVEDANGEKKFSPCKNVHEDPKNNFRINPAELERALAYTRLVAVVHSHTQGQVCPSRSDMEGQISTGVPWVVVVMHNYGIREHFSFPESLDAPIKGATFRHGVNDCYSTIRKWWWQNKGVKLPEFPRDDSWWTPGDGAPAEDMYLSFFPKAGFRQLTPEEIQTRPRAGKRKLILQPGDVGLVKIASKHYNHGVVYTGGQLMLHHLCNRISAEEPVTRWFPKIDIWLRYTGEVSE